MFKGSNVKSFVKYCDSNLAEYIDTSVAVTEICEMAFSYMALRGFE